MRRTKLFTLVFSLVLLLPYETFSQQVDSVASINPAAKKRRHYYVIPFTLIGVGSAVMLDKDGDEFFLSNFEVREERNENFINFSNHLDDYLQHAPSLSVFSLSLCGIKGKHDLPNQVALYIKSELVMLSVVYALKYSVGETRPDTGKRNSFPSGHTAQAFTAASFLSREYGYKSIWISIGAYTAASAVGVMRVLNNRHWVSDILVGAGIGILSSDIIYRTHKNRWGHRIKTSSLKVSPFSAYGSTGLSFTYKL